MFAGCKNSQATQDAWTPASVHITSTVADAQDLTGNLCFPCQKQENCFRSVHVRHAAQRHYRAHVRLPQQASCSLPRLRRAMRLVLAEAVPIQQVERAWRPHATALVSHATEGLVRCATARHGPFALASNIDALLFQFRCDAPMDNRPQRISPSLSGCHAFLHQNRHDPDRLLPEIA